MAKDRKKIFDKILKLIKKEKLVFLQHAYVMAGISHDSFYRYYPKNSEQYEIIVDALAENKVAMKTKMLKKWSDSDNATLQTNLYKLLSNDDEFKRLSKQQIDLKTESVDKIEIEVIAGNNESKD